MENYEKDPTLTVLAIFLALIALVLAAIVSQETYRIVMMSFLLAFLLCLYLRQFTPLSSKIGLKWIEWLLRAGLGISALFMMGSLLSA
jgi:hypothetical protein